MKKWMEMARNVSILGLSQMTQFWNIFFKRLVLFIHRLYINLCAVSAGHLNWFTASPVHWCDYDKMCANMGMKLRPGKYIIIQPD